MIRKVQDNAVARNAGALTSPQSAVVHFASGTASGNLLICTVVVSLIHGSNPPPTPTIQPPSTPGFTWTLAADTLSPVTTDGPNFDLSRIAVYYIANAPTMGSGVSTTATVTTPSNPTAQFSVEACLFEYSGVLASSPLAAVASNSGTSAHPDSGTVAVAATSLVFVAAAFDPSLLGPGSGFSYPTLSALFTAAQYIPNVSPGNYSSAFTDDGSGSFGWAAIAIVFKSADSNGTAIIQGLSLGVGRQAPGGFHTVLTATTADAGNWGVPTKAGNLLICICCCDINNGGPSPPLPAFDTPVTAGITWTLAASKSAAGDISASPGNVAYASGVAIYYCANAPSVSPATGTSVTVRVSSSVLTMNMYFNLLEVAGPLGSVEASASANGEFSVLHGTANLSVVSPQTLTLVASHCVANIFGLSSGSGYSSIPESPPLEIQYRLDVAPGSVPTYFSGTTTASWVCVAIAFGAGGQGGGGAGGDTGCGACPGPRLLQLIPGFSDIPDGVLQADDPAFALHVGEIATNATFGMVRMEVFPCLLVHGDTVPVPTSCWDGYKYSREELNYVWAVQNSTDHSTNWISGPDSLWFSNWNVNQTTGEVFSEEWYERSSTADTRLAAKSNDGSLMVFTIAQRQKTNMIMASPASYTTISEATIATDKPYTQDLAQHLSQNAKFSCVNAEFFYLGEYINGNTVTLPVSPVDGYTYSMAECKFEHAWRWTSAESNYIQPPGNYEQAAPFQASISAAGLVSITVTFSTSGGTGVVTAPGYGRIAAFAFCTRSATPSSGSLANNFTELGLDFFAPGRTVRASELLTIKRNIDEAILSPEFFGPTDYADAAIVTLPNSPVDGYVYSRAELQYIWSWSDVHNNSGGTHVRLPLFLGSVDPDTGAVTLRCWRLPPGGPNVDDSNVNARIRVIVMATRQKTHPQLSLGQKTSANTPADTGTIDNSIIQINGA